MDIQKKKEELEEEFDRLVERRERFQDSLMKVNAELERLRGKFEFLSEMEEKRKKEKEENNSGM